MKMVDFYRLKETLNYHDMKYLKAKVNMQIPSCEFKIHIQVLPSALFQWLYHELRLAFLLFQSDHAPAGKQIFIKTHHIDSTSTLKTF